ncbi:hypothetical protein DXG01_015790 [Tephrocybe rancida]|nr:hypothetical protein DXG01_015790 [Tephrocybe rancida]
MSSKGNHYAVKNGVFQVVTDDTSIKDVIVLHLSSKAPSKLTILFENQIGSLNMVQDSDKEEERANGEQGKFNVKLWVKNEHDDPEEINDCIVLTTGKKYIVPAHADNHKANKLMKRRVEDVEPEGVSTQKEASGIGNVPLNDIKAGSVYPPSVLPDYGGSYFSHNHAKLVQLDIHDPDNKLIPPWEMYNKVNTGAVVLAICSLHMYLSPGNMSKTGVKYKDRKTYQLNVESLKVLDYSTLPVVPCLCPLTPAGTLANMSAPGLKAFDDFYIDKKPCTNVQPVASTSTTSQTASNSGSAVTLSGPIAVQGTIPPVLNTSKTGTKTQPFMPPSVTHGGGQQNSPKDKEKKNPKKKEAEKNSNAMDELFKGRNSTMIQVPFLNLMANIQQSACKTQETAILMDSMTAGVYLITAMSGDAYAVNGTLLIAPNIAAEDWHPRIVKKYIAIEMYIVHFLLPSPSSFTSLVRHSYPTNNCLAQFGVGTPVDPQPIFPKFLAHNARPRFRL